MVEWMRYCSRLCVCLLLCIAGTASVSSAMAADETGTGGQVLQGFVEKEKAAGKGEEIATKKKHQILFIMGVALLILLLATAYFGVAVGVMGKPLFVPHMICAGLSVTLAIAHSIVAIVWFYPF